MLSSLFRSTNCIREGIKTQIAGLFGLYHFILSHDSQEETGSVGRTRNPERLQQPGVLVLTLLPS